MFRIRAFAAGLTAAAIALAALTAAQAAPAPGKAPSADPRDFSGVWYITNAARLNRDQQVKFGAEAANDPRSMSSSRVMWPQDRQAPPFTPWGRQEFERRFNGHIDSAPVADPSTDCMPHGMPRIMIAPYPVQIVHEPGAISMLFEVNHNTRRILIDQPMPKDPKPTFMGTSVGRWEGDALVIETIAIAPGSIFDEVGTPQSGKLKITERLRKIEGGRLLEDLITIEDPGAYTRPWTARETLAWSPDTRMMEYSCEENNRNASVGGMTTAR